MAHLRTADLLRLHEAIALIYADFKPGALFDRLSEAAARAIRAETACFDGFDPNGQIGHLGSYPEETFSPLTFPVLAAHLPEHPLFPQIIGQRNGNALRTSDYCHMPQYFRSLLFNEYYRPLTLTHQLIVGLLVPQYGWITCALNRSRRDFTATDRTVLQLLTPHFRAAVALSHTIRELQQATGAPPLAAVPGAFALTPRETVILDHLKRGLPDKDISRVCNISPRTVQNHLQNIYAKLGVDNRTAALCRVLGVAG